MKKIQIIQHTFLIRIIIFYAATQTYRIAS